MKKDANHENYDDGDRKGKGEDENLKKMPLEKGAGTVTGTFLNAVAYSSYVDCLLEAEQKVVPPQIFDTVQQL